MKKYWFRTLVFVLTITFTVICFIPAASAAEVADMPEKSPLNDVTLAFYHAIRTELEKVSDGTRTDSHLVFDEDALKAMGAKTEWTAAEFGVESIGAVEKAKISEQFMAQFEGFSHLLDALMHDMPGELYWFDKTKGFLRELSSMSWGVAPNVERINIVNFHCYFHVAPTYQGEGYDPKNPTLDPMEIARAKSAIAAADAIVERYASLPDHQKLVAYRDEICDLVSYDNTAVGEDYTGGYGDPWQMIYVFDGDPTTNVVCEGYAKAFAYLCSKSVFAADVECYTVTGDMQGGTGAGGHMWNIVTIDGVSYLVDVTNSDEGTVGQKGALFLVGYDRTVEGAYVFSAGNTEIAYIYYSDTVALWEKNGILLLSDSDYIPPSFEILIPTDGLFYTGNAPTVGGVGSEADILYRADTLPAGDYDWYAEWYQNGTKLTEAPTLPGTYLVQITAVNSVNFLYRYTEEREITIGRAVPQYTVPDVLEAVYGDLLTSVTLPMGFSWDASLPANTLVGNAGQNSFAAIYVPENTELYLTVELMLTVDVTPKDITNAEILFDAFPHYTGAVLSPVIKSAVLDGENITYTADGDSAKEVGEYTLTVTGTGNYSGTVTAKWSILPPENSGGHEGGDSGGEQTGNPNQPPFENTGTYDGNQNASAGDNGQNDIVMVVILAIVAVIAVPLCSIAIIASGKKKKKEKE